MRTLIKYATRARPKIFLTRLREWIDSATSPALLSVVVSYDEDDATMTPEIIQEAHSIHPALVCHGGVSESKIHAINRDMDRAGDWDVVIVVSDDFFCRRKGWDDVIREKMQKHFPDTDGVLWFHDGSKQRDIMTLSCIGRRYYDRDGFIYNPSYRSFFCDNEATLLAQQRNRIAFIEQPIATHEHPSWGGVMKKDGLYLRNNIHWKADESTYHRRKAAGFPRE